MKKILLTCSLLCLILSANAQTQTKTEDVNPKLIGNNEIKLNVLNSILGLIEVNYERILSDNMSVGLAAFVNVDKEVYNYNFGFIPNYRIYFGAKKANGFFIEGNAAFISTNRNYYYYYSPANNGYSTNNLNFGLGAAAGAKFLTKTGFVGEVYAGLGRFFGQNRSDEAYPRIGITLGKRF